LSEKGREKGRSFKKIVMTSNSSSDTSAAAATTSQPSRAALNRLMSDLREMQSTPPEGCSAAPLNETSLFQWNASIIGPDDSPWEGGIYGLRLQFPDTYPSKPPRISLFFYIFQSLYILSNNNQNRIHL
jgi:ubiquitin-protein ligase